uniref:DNA-directed RNA polymerase subunit beta n=1 Tax=Toxarium undulatum TaxID=210620 RepID=A0A1D8D9I4_9STRA|nr:RNA polymerase b-subunit [Toxarium undulatum]AOS86602.1 RNA polymerase b-subunit [Toxarium undulatum]
MKYITAFSDFIEIQRVSFCWFIAQGLNNELKKFTKISDLTTDTEYLLFTEEFNLVKPKYSILKAKKYNADYAAKLIVPIEIRNKQLNNIKYHHQFMLLNLPLMTTFATFILNGCERVIVSQIIRSPGVYFEKNKTQKNKNRFKRKLSANIETLRNFVPSGLPISSEQQLLIEQKSANKKILKLFNGNFLKYTIRDLKIKYYSLYFLILFTVYRTILKISNSLSKEQKIKIFSYWLANEIKHDRKNYEFSLIVQYLNLITKNLLKKYLFRWNFLSEYLVKFHILGKEKAIIKTWFREFIILNQVFTHDLGLEQKHNITRINTKINKFRKVSQIKLSNQLFLVLYKPQINFLFLFQITKNFDRLIVSEKFKFKTFKPIFYFSKSRKEFIKYSCSRTKEQKKNNQFPNGKFLKSKSQILRYKEENEVKDFSIRKYSDKEFYTAIIIPEYGSWIRFIFQKNNRLTGYNYPIKNREDEIMIQIDKITQKSIIQVFREIGITDLEIYQNLHNADFFYFNKPTLTNSLNAENPLLRFAITKYNQNISEFFKIFDQRYYKLGKVGRFKINNRLQLKIQSNALTYIDIYAILDALISMSISKTVSDDIDHLKNRRIRPVGELLQNFFKIGFQRLERIFTITPNRNGGPRLHFFSIVGKTMREFFVSSQLSQYMDQTNPLSALTHRRRISGLGPGGLDRNRISFAIRDIHPSHYGRICPIETPEGQNVGLIASLTTCARVNHLGFLETPFWRVINGKVIKTGNPVYLTAELEDFYKIAPFDIPISENNYLTQNIIPVRYQQDFITVSPFDVSFINISPVQFVSIAASLIPFFEHDDANRALMGSNMQRQSVPLIFPQSPIVGTGFEMQIASDSGMVIRSQIDGIVRSVTANQIIIHNQNGNNFKYILQKYSLSNQETCINYRPIVWKGQKVNSGQMITDGPGITNGELALGQNVLVGYMPWQGYNFEDAILINESLIYKDIFTSIHIQRYEIVIDQSEEIHEQTTKNIPNLTLSEVQNLNDDGIIMTGTFVKPGDILVGKIIPKDESDDLPESKLLRAIFGVKAKGIVDNSFKMPKGEYGRVIETITFNKRIRSVYKFEKIQIYIAQIRKIQVGDKIAGRHGNKGVISRILPRQDMPFLPDGTPIDIILNPLGVPSRMNVGQLYECLLGFAGHKLNKRFKILPFDEMYRQEASRILINKKLRQASIERDEAWIFNPYCPGKMVLIDGRTGKEFDNPITVGNAYMLKLIHLVDDKMHSRATGPYSLVTQQPLGGKANYGGQRFGEMEVWALEGFGAAFTLKEILTIKSDDIKGRNETIYSIVKGYPISTSGIPESFKVLLLELRSIGLDISTYKIEQFDYQKSSEVEVNIIEEYDPLLKIFPTMLKDKNISL